MAEAAEKLIAGRRLRFRFMKHDSWENALFVHWPVDPATLAALLPRGLEPDVLEGSAWVGLVLLTERGVSAHGPLGRRLMPPIDHYGANVRTYVRRGGVPGIFFFSLECSSLLASLGARLAGIPYCPAHMERQVDIERPVASARGVSCCRGDSSTHSQDPDGFVFQFASTRRGIGPFGRRPSVQARWRLASQDPRKDEEVFRTRARWFVERYSVYAAFPWGKGPVLLRGDVQHPPWPVQHVELEALSAEPLLAAAGLPGVAEGPKAPEPHVCFTRGVGPVEFWMLEPV